MENHLISIREAGRTLGYTGLSSGKTTMHKHCNEGRLVKVRIGGRSFVTNESVWNLIFNSTVTPRGRVLAESAELEREADAEEVSSDLQGDPSAQTDTSI